MRHQQLVLTVQIIAVISCSRNTRVNNRVTPTIVRVDDVEPVPWRNGGGSTRELLAWPDSRDWIVRVSVADILASGPFSAFPGVDRWFAVLSGDAVRLETAGMDPQVLTASQLSLHAFSGDVATHCTALGRATRDFNLMARRARTRVTPRPLQQSPVLETRAEGAGLFVVQPIEVREEPGAAWQLPAMAMAWWPNPQRERRVLRAEVASVRGWWFEVHGRGLHGRGLDRGGARAHPERMAIGDSR